LPALAFSGAALDRAAVVRQEPDRVLELLSGPGACAVAAGASAVLLRGESLVRLPLRDARLAAHVAHGGPILLGIEREHPVFALNLDTLPVSARHSVSRGAELVTLRDAAARLTHAESGLAAYAIAVLGWHRRHGFCANCGAQTQIEHAGLERRCPVCGASHFPRTDPVVIMLVEHDDRLLLGRRAGWPPGRYSVLAGFVSPGETPEEAVVREVREESGVEAREPRYVASQPWPFPASLMLGFEARAAGGEPRPGDGELSEVGWFDRAGVQAAASGEGSLQLPPPISIARHLVDRWLARE
jgi:NAD+ diphosphatase